MQRLSEHLEDYLETILELQNKNTVARVKDIAEKLGVLSGTVTSALRTLSERGFINYKPYSFITLTEKGEEIAKEVLRRHQLIKGFLQCVLLLEESKAEENACRQDQQNGHLQLKIKRVLNLHNFKYLLMRKYVNTNSILFYDLFRI